jgi:ATP-dependent helicase/nuclease subunit B
MPTEFLLASVGAGKTDAVQARLIALKERTPLAKVWCLLATERQINAFRQRLITREDGQRVYFNVEFFTFYGLYHHLLESAGKPQRILDHAARFRLLRLILNRLAREGELEHFHQIAEMPGLIRILADFILELKQGLNDDETFGLQARSVKDRDIAKIYTAYQETLRRYDLVDIEGEGWVARDELTNNEPLARDVRLLIVDGYDQFNKLQADLLTLLASRVGETLVTLTTVPGREATIGRRFDRALQRLTDAHKAEPIVYRINRPVVTTNYRHPMLRGLVEGIFSPNAERQPIDNSLLLLEAPDPPAEVAAALRRAKALLLDGARPDDVLIAVRDWTRYSSYFDAQARAYGVPLALDAGETLAQNPAVYTLLRLLDLHKTNFRRRDLLDVLQSAYLRVPGIGAAEIDLLERISRERLVVEDERAWIGMFDAAQVPLTDEDGEPIEGAAATQAQLTALRGALAAFFAALTPTVGKLPSEYAAWLEDLIGDDPMGDLDDAEADPAAPPRYTLDMIAQARKRGDAADEDRIVARDLAALHAVKRLLRGMLGAQRLFAALELHEKPSWDTFYADLVTAIKAATVPRAAGRDGRILVTTVGDARGLPHRHVIVLGLSEGVFPMRAAEDPLYLDTERLQLRERNIDLQTQRERSDDDGLFYEMISLATESLTLTRTTVENGAAQPPSHLWRATQAVFPTLRAVEQRVGRVVPLVQAAAPREALLAAADGLTRGDATIAPMLHWLTRSHTAAWAHIARARAIEGRRMSRAAHDHYSGRLHDPRLIDAAAAALTGRLWSATQLNDYGICGFRFFASRLLKLKPIKAPEEGIDAAQLGTLYHEILEATYTQLAAEGIPIAAEHLDRALAILDDHAARLLPDAPQRLGFRAPALWRAEGRAIHERLRVVVRDDFDPDSDVNKALAKIGIGARRPYGFEVAFGGGKGYLLDVGGERLRLNGKIDRIDLTDDGAVIIDYKLGSKQIPSTEITRGRNFQMLAYLLAAGEQGRVLGGAFWHLTSRKPSGMMRADADDVISAGKAHLRENLARGRGGDFATEANKVEEGKCARYCDYSQFCRSAVMGKHKGRRE